MVITIPSGPLQTNCYLYSSDDEHLFIIDPADDAKQIIGKVSETGLTPTAIILTHTHFDHILAVGKVVKNYLGIPVYCHREEVDHLGESGRVLQLHELRDLVPQLLSYARESLEMLPEASEALNHKDLVKDSTLRVLHTPGHTPGSICLYDVEQNILFSGDTLFRDSIGRSDFAGGDHETLISHIKGRLLDLPGETIVYPGHGDSTTIGYEKTHNPYL